MNKRQILAMTNAELDSKVNELLGVDASVGISYSTFIADAWSLFESVYSRDGKIKQGAWVLGTVYQGRNCAHACLMWKSKSFTKHRPLKVEVTCKRGAMAKAITQAWICAMIGISDV